MDFQSLIERKLEPVGASNNDIIYRCPQCEGTEGSGHLYVNYDKGYFNCFKCSLSGRRIEGLLRVLQISLDYDYSKLYDERDKLLDSIISPNKNKVPEKIIDYSTDLGILTQYYNYHTMPLSTPAYTYLLNRGLTPSLIESLGIREGVNRYGEKFNMSGREYIGRDYSGRILVPSLREEGTISFYLGRDYIGDKSAKYLNAPKELAAASEDVWSLDIIETPSIVICEGVFTAIAVNQALGKMTACATYGKSIAHQSSNDSSFRVTSQGEKLLNRKFNQYIVFYDKDAYKESYDTAKYLYDRGASVRVVTIKTEKYGPKADAADMTKEEIIEHIRGAEEFNEFSGLF